MKGMVERLVIIIAVLISAVIILSNTTTLIRESRTIQTITDSKQLLKTVDAVINQLLFEATGARRAVDLSIGEGKFVFSGKEDRIKIRLEQVTLLKPGTRIEEEGVFIQGGGVLDVYESDILNDNQTDLVLENSAILFAVKKLGSPSSPVSINTSNIVTMIKNKQAGVNSTNPRSGVFVNEKEKSSYGTGYTQLALGNNVQTGSILVHVNSTAGITYDAVFTLSAATDFIELEIKNVQGI